MRAVGVLVFAAFACALGVAPAGATPVSGVAAPRASAICAAPTVSYAGAVYRVVRLRSHRDVLGLGLRRPVARDTAQLNRYDNCVDVVVCTVGEPCPPQAQPPPLVSDVRVVRVAGVRSSVALAAANPRVLYVAATACSDAGSGRGLAACLKRTERPPAVVLAYDDSPAVQALRAAGLPLRRLGVGREAMFGERPWQRYTHRIAVVRFPGDAEAAAEAAKIDPDGTSYRSGNLLVHVSWVDASHFFLASREIVVYVGRDEHVLGALRSAFGERFAGR